MNIYIYKYEKYNMTMNTKNHKYKKINMNINKRLLLHMSNHEQQ